MVLSPVGGTAPGAENYGRELAGIAVGLGSRKRAVAGSAILSSGWRTLSFVAKCETVDILELTQRDRNHGLISKYPPTEQ